MMSTRHLILPFLLSLGACLPMMQPGGGAGSPSSGATSTSSGAGDPSSSGSSQESSSGGSTSSAAGGGAPAPAGPVSVTIRSSCPSTVKVFYGDDPGFGSGTQSSVDSNSVESHTFNAGDMFWIIDDSEKGITSTTVGPTTSEIDIGSSCKDLQTH